MNAHVSMFTRSDLDRFGMPWGYCADEENPGCWLALDSDAAIKADSLERLDRLFRGGLHSGTLSHARRSQLRGRNDAARALDAAEVFYTNTLEQMLTEIVRAPKTTTIMTGPDAALPVMATLRPGQTHGVYDILSTTGQASWVEPAGAQKLQQVNEYADRARYSSGFVGVGYGYGLIEMWRSAEMGRPLEAMRRMTAEGALQRFCERVLLSGDLENEAQGVLKNSAAYQWTLGDSFTNTAPSDPDGAQVLLQIMEMVFAIIGETYSANATPTGIIAPRNDLRALQRLRYTNDTPALPDFYEMHPWLRLVTWVEHIETSSDTGGSQWVMWADDPNELWSEMAPAPMLFGPWQDSDTGLRRQWGLIQQLGGVISRRRERMVRFQLGAA